MRKRIILTFLVISTVLAGCGGKAAVTDNVNIINNNDSSYEESSESSQSKSNYNGTDENNDGESNTEGGENMNLNNTGVSNSSANLMTGESGIKTAYFAGGCFWGMEKFMSMVPGVMDVVSGYANGDSTDFDNPTYDMVLTGKTGYKEAVKVTYDASVVNYEMLVRSYYIAIDPTVSNRQGNDIGEQYQTGIFYMDDTQKEVAERVSDEVRSNVRKFAVLIEPFSNFYDAEEYHQDYLVKHPLGYCHISNAEIEEMKKMFEEWKAEKELNPSSTQSNINNSDNNDKKKESNVSIDNMNTDNANKETTNNSNTKSQGNKTYTKPSDAELKKSLSKLQYDVTQKSDTEPPFRNEYWDHFEKGIYVDIVTGEPLFSSTDKYESSCGWPAFSVAKNNSIQYIEDRSHGMVRTEVRSGAGDSHLGHVFDGDYESPTGVRYCINSASIRFIPFDKLDEAGYGYTKEWFE